MSSEEATSILEEWDRTQVAINMDQLLQDVGSTSREMGDDALTRSGMPENVVGLAAAVFAAQRALL